MGHLFSSNKSEGLYDKDEHSKLIQFETSFKTCKHKITSQNFYLYADKIKYYKSKGKFIKCELKINGKKFLGTLDVNPKGHIISKGDCNFEINCNVQYGILYVSSTDIGKKIDKSSKNDSIINNKISFLDKSSKEDSIINNRISCTLPEDNSITNNKKRDTSPDDNNITDDNSIVDDNYIVTTKKIVVKIKEHPDGDIQCSIDTTPDLDPDMLPAPPPPPLPPMSLKSKTGGRSKKTNKNSKKKSAAKKSKKSSRKKSSRKKSSRKKSSRKKSSRKKR
jgi:hypothetical protein